MEEIKVPREEVVGYRAADGTSFRNKDACEAYEHGALCAAKCAANCLKKSSKPLDAVMPIVGCYEEEIAVYEIDNANDLQVLNTYLKMAYAGGDVVEPKYIGQKVAIQFWIDDDGYHVLGSYEDLMSNFKAHMDKLFGLDTEVEA